MAMKYIPYTPNTVEGQAILDNFTRTQRVLRYRENGKVFDRIKRGMPAYEMETAETVGNNTENFVIRGECLSACAYLKEKGIKVDLVYIDPPFASGADYAKKVYIRRNPKLAGKIAVAEQEMEIEELRSFEEKMYGDIWQKEEYLNWMYENLTAIKGVMSETASIYVHLDWHISHYVKILLDEVFGEDNFVNEIIWHYEDKFATGGNSLDKNHDTIFYYAFDNYVFNPIIIPKDTTKRALRKKVNGKTIDVKDENGNKIIVEYSEKKADDVWDLGRTISKNEMIDYATQKPEALLKRIIEASSDKEMVVADFFGGSGVTAKVAHDLGRKFIHCDIGINSIQIARDRLVSAKAGFQVVEIKDGILLFRNPQQTMDKLARIIPGLQKNVSGVNDFWFGAVIEAKDGTVPVYVPNLLNTQEKVLDIPAINTIINQELQNLEIDVKKVIVYYIDIDNQKELDKFIRDNNATTIQVELRDLKNLLAEVVLNDEVQYELSEQNGKYTITVTNFISDRLIQKINEFNEKGRLQRELKDKQFTPIIISENALELIELISLDCENNKGTWHSSEEIKIDKLGYVIRNGEKTKDFWDGRICCRKKPLRLKIRNICGDESIIVCNLQK